MENSRSERDVRVTRPPGEGWNIAALEEYHTRNLLYSYVYIRYAEEWYYAHVHTHIQYHTCSFHLEKLKRSVKYSIHHYLHVSSLCLFAV